MQTFTSDKKMTTGERRGRVWQSLQDGMKQSGHNEATFAAALSAKAGKEITPRRIDSWLRGQRRPRLDELLLMSSLLNLTVEQMAADHPKKIS